MSKKLSDEHETTRLFIPIPQDMRDRLQAYCKAEGLKMSEVVRDRIAEFLISVEGRE